MSELVPHRLEKHRCLRGIQRFNDANDRFLEPLNALDTSHIIVVAVSFRSIMMLASERTDTKRFTI